MQKFLVIQTAFIGDVVLATSVIEELHACFPEARIDFLVRKGNEGLLNGHPYLQKLWVWDKQNNKWGNLFRMIGQIRKEQYSTVINVQRFAATGLLTALSGAKMTIGYDKNPFSSFFSRKIPHLISSRDNPIHEIDRCHALVEGLSKSGQAFKPRLYPAAADLESVSKYKSRPYICVAPASVWPTKQFPLGQWISFLQKLPSNLQVYLLGGPTDFELCESIRAEIPGTNIQNLAGKLSLIQSAALQRDADMNYVNDSAPLHFASAVNAPVTAIYCSTIPAFGFGPLSDKSFIVEVEEKLDCRPCGLHGKKACPRGHFHCAKWIRDEQLLEKLTGRQPKRSAGG